MVPAGPRRLAAFAVATLTTPGLARGHRGTQSRKASETPPAISDRARFACLCLQPAHPHLLAARAGATCAASMTAVVLATMTVARTFFDTVVPLGTSVARPARTYPWSSVRRQA